MIPLPVRIGENDSEIVDRDGALVAYTHGTALVSRAAVTRHLISILNAQAKREVAGRPASPTPAVPQ